jgi:hypothetical protein
MFESELDSDSGRLAARLWSVCAYYEKMEYGLEHLK